MTSDDLTAAVERLRDESCYPTGNRDSRVRDAIRTVLDALESAQQDARRYCWLRDHAPQDWAPWADERGDTTAGEIDAALDAAQAEQTSGSTDGRAADPIADVIAGCRDRARQATTLKEEREWSDVADALERLARELDAMQKECGRWHHEAGKNLERAERAEAERDALRECVRAADAMREFVPICYASPTDGYAPNAAAATYDAARAKVTLP